MHGETMGQSLQDDSQESAAEEAKERESVLTGVEAVIALEHEWVGLEQEIDDAVDE